jgi:uncharacterized protein
LNIEKLKMTRDAIKKSDLEKIKEIFENDNEYLNEKTAFGTWLHDAVILGKGEVVRLLLDLGIDVNIKAENMDGNALYQAVSFGYLDIAKHLIMNGVNIEIDEPSKNPLFAAIYARNIEAAKIIIGLGIDVTIKYTGERMKNMDALAYAEERGELEIAELIRAELAR